MKRRLGISEPYQQRQASNHYKEGKDGHLASVARRSFGQRAPSRPEMKINHGRRWSPKWNKVAAKAGALSTMVEQVPEGRRDHEFRFQGTDRRSAKRHCEKG